MLIYLGEIIIKQFPRQQLRKMNCTLNRSDTRCRPKTDFACATQYSKMTYLGVQTKNEMKQKITITRVLHTAIFRFAHKITFQKTMKINQKLVFHGSQSPCKNDDDGFDVTYCLREFLFFWKLIF